MLNIRIAEELKKRAEAILASQNISATDAVTSLYRFIVEHGRLPVQQRIITTEEPVVFAMSDISQLESVYQPGEIRTLLNNTNVTIQFADGGRRRAFLAEDGVQFAYRFLAFMSGQGIGCSEPQRFVGLISDHDGRSPAESLQAQIVALLQNLHGHDLTFSVSGDTNWALPPHSLISELKAEFGFSDEQAQAVLAQVRPTGKKEDHTNG
ncbi:hypothetical protein DH20_14505 [Pantoea agglomerans]|nr:hypothetical protein [Pantoea agglomerans]